MASSGEQHWTQHCSYWCPGTVRFQDICRHNDDEVWVSLFQVTVTLEVKWRMAVYIFCVERGKDYLYKFQWSKFVLRTRFTITHNWLLKYERKFNSRKLNNFSDDQLKRVHGPRLFNNAVWYSAFILIYSRSSMYGIDTTFASINQECAIVAHTVSESCLA